VLRNFGLFLSERGRRDEARPLLRQSVERARESQDFIEIGKALAAYGIFQQHNADLVEGGSLLREAGGLLPPTGSWQERHWALPEGARSAPLIRGSRRWARPRSASDFKRWKSSSGSFAWIDSRKGSGRL
jgi:hypothetical protein